MGLFGDIGSTLGREGGELFGSLLPFRTGGKVPGAHYQPVPILAHGQEFVLPYGVRPTKSQKKAVAKRKRDY